MLFMMQLTGVGRFNNGTAPIAWLAPILRLAFVQGLVFRSRGDALMGQQIREMTDQFRFAEPCEPFDNGQEDSQ